MVQLCTCCLRDVRQYTRRWLPHADAMRALNAADFEHAVRSMLLAVCRRHTALVTEKNYIRPGTIRAALTENGMTNVRRMPFAASHCITTLEIEIRVSSCPWQYEQRKLLTNTMPSSACCLCSTSLSWGSVLLETYAADVGSAALSVLPAVPASLLSSKLKERKGTCSPAGNM